MQPPPEYSDLGDGKLEINPRPTLLQRLPRKVATDEALAGLHAELAISTVIYEQHGDAGRAGAGRALRDVIDFLRRQGLPTPALLPLIDLVSGLDELDRRVVIPLLTPKRGPGRPPKADASARTDAFLAVVMECCVRHFRDDEKMHDFLDPAKRLAAKLINQSALGFDVTPDRMEDVRETVTDPATHGLTRSLFNEFMLDVEADPPPLAWARAFIDTGWVRAAKVSE